MIIQSLRIALFMLIVDLALIVLTLIAALQYPFRHLGRRDRSRKNRADQSI